MLLVHCQNCDYYKDSNKKDKELIPKMKRRILGAIALHGAK